MDLLHDELKLIYIPQEETKQTEDEWKEVGEKNVVKTFNNDHVITQRTRSLISDIFGGLIRTELTVEGSKTVSITLEQFFMLNLEISRCEEIENCLESFFTERVLNDYKNNEGKKVIAKHKYLIDELPKILILHLKRFIYKDKPIKMQEDIYFPDVLKISDFILSPHLQVGAFEKKSKQR